MPSMYLNKTEKRVLYQKYISNGFSSEEANEKIKQFIEHLGKLVKRLSKCGKKSKEEINQKFKEEFEKICMRIDAEATEKRL